MNEKRAEKLGYLLWKVREFSNDYPLTEECIAKYWKHPAYSRDVWENSTPKFRRSSYIGQAKLFMRLQ